MRRHLPAAIILLAASSLQAQTTGISTSARSYGTNGFRNYYDNRFNQSNSGGGLSSSSIDANSSYTFSAGFSSQSASVSGSYTNNDHNGEGFANMISFEPITVTPANPALMNANCQLLITYKVSGNVTSDTMSASTYYPYASVTFPSTGGVQFSGVTGTTSGSFDYVDTLNYNFGSQMSLRLNATANTLISTVGANGATTGSASISVSRGSIQAFVNGQPVGMTMTGAGGSSGTFPVQSGNSYDGISVTNGGLGSNGTQVTLGGMAHSDSTVQIDLRNAPDNIRAVSDIAGIDGMGNNPHYVGVTYNYATAVSLTGTDTTLVLGTIGEDGIPKNAIVFNLDGGANSHFIDGPFNPATMSLPGYYGIDTVNHIAWAYVDHNSDYVVFAPTPEPALLAFAVVGVFAVRRFRRSAPMSTTPFA